MNPCTPGPWCGGRSEDWFGLREYRDPDDCLECPVRNEKKIGKCKECGRKKELTIHSTCWPCHLGRVNLNTSIEVRKNK